MLRAVIFCVLFVSFVFQVKGQDHPCDSPPTSGCNRYRPHEDCNRVWNCEQSPPYLDRCNPDRYWNQERCICDEQVNVGECVGGTRPPQPETESTFIPTTATTEAPTGPGICPVNGTIKIPHEERCDSYYQCQDGDRSDERHCPLGLWFDPALQECNFPHLVECTPSTAPQCPAEGIHQIPVKVDCSAYVLCANGDPVMISKCVEGTLFDSIDLVCKPATDAVCYD